ncbi:hypothetical protein HORIV_42730 [Vreelandella olivaria]|uniref:Uncharacterized protein n=1 Tax=Vreelandella olivaria TaxID=390919 RepID=A0ABN5WYD9_9GAMM|nr:hypothetical protein HORIV_42730 [Halomonas olivaria]
MIQKGAGEERGRAQAIEAKAFAKLALSSVAFNLVGLFLNDQVVKKKPASMKSRRSPLSKRPCWVRALWAAVSLIRVPLKARRF